MADGIYATPGSAVAQAIQEILQRRREESRQAMQEKFQLDKFTADKDFENRRLAQNERQIGLEAERNTLQQRDFKERSFQSRADKLPHDPSQVDVGSLDPEFADWLEKNGLIRKAPGGLPVKTATPVDVGGDMPGLAATSLEGAPPRREYVGSREWQKTQDSQRALEKIFTDPSFTEGDDTMRAAMMARAIPYGFNPPASAFEPTEPLRIVSPRGQVTTHPDQRTRGNSIVRLDDPPNPPAWSRPQIYQAFDNAGNMIGTTPAMDMESVARYQQENPTHVLRPIGFQPSQQNGPSSSLLNELSRARGNLEFARQNRTMWQFGPSANELAAAEAYRQALGNVFGVSGAPSELQSLALEIALDPEDSKKTVLQLIQEGLLNPPPPAAEIPKLEELLNYARGIAQPK